MERERERVYALVYMYVSINIERLFSVVPVGAAVYLLASLLAPDSESNRERLVWKVSLLQRITVV